MIDLIALYIRFMDKASSPPLTIVQIENKSEPLTCYDDLVRIIMIWCSRQELNLFKNFYSPFAIRLSDILRQSSATFIIDKKLLSYLFFILMNHFVVHLISIWSIILIVWMPYAIITFASSFSRPRTSRTSCSACAAGRTARISVSTITSMSTVI